MPMGGLRVVAQQIKLLLVIFASHNRVLKPEQFVQLSFQLLENVSGKTVNNDSRAEIPANMLSPRGRP